MQQFKTDYTDDLISLTTLLERMIKEETEFTTKELDIADHRIQELDLLLKQEIEDWKWDTKNLLDPMKAQV